jgi:UTP--glucose-1-phosphate uridylyltransferase
MKSQIIKKAVFPVAGFGTRFLPATKANPKEMLPIVDKPLIQYAVEEAIQAGITDMIFVTSSSKGSIEDHFDRHFELEMRLQQQDKQNLLHITRSILPAGINCIYVRQSEPLGLGDAVLKARPIIGNEPFAVLLADDLFHATEKNCMQQMVEHFKTNPHNIIAVEKIPLQETHKYGIVDLFEQKGRLNRVKNIIEKPAIAQAPSDLAVAGRYILKPEIFDYLANTSKGAGDEIQLTDGIASLLAQEEVYAYEFEGKRFDCGSKIGYLKASVMIALEHEEVRDEFKEFLEVL